VWIRLCDPHGILPTKASFMSYERRKAMAILRSLLVVLFLLPGVTGENSLAFTFKPLETREVIVEGNLHYTVVDAKGLAMMLMKKDFIFINVHVPYEGEIEKTDLFIPYDEIRKNLDKLPADKNAKIVLYCRTDRMSNIAAKTLVNLGYTNVWVLEDGMIEWRKAGYQLQFRNG
jgi:rhodanese-related sulfurtransferase